MDYDSLPSLQSAAIVCEHIARANAPIHYAIKTDSDFPEDSGWQFFCSSEDEELVDNAQIWSLKEVIDLEPSLFPYILNDEECCLVKNGNLKKWLKK